MEYVSIIRSCTKNKLLIMLVSVAVEQIAEADPPSETMFKGWQRTWERCVQLEKGFWDMAMALS